MTRIVLLTEIPAPFRIPLWNALAARGEVDFEVAFLATGQPNRPYRLHETEFRFRWRVLPGVRPMVRGRWIALDAGVTRAVRRADLVVVGGWNQPAFWQAAATARLLRRRLAVWVESTRRDARSEALFAERARRALVGAAEAVLVPGRAAAEYVESLGARRVLLAPNAVDRSIFGDRVEAERRRRAELRRTFGLDGCVFLAVGRLAPEKGFDVLLRALAETDGACVALLGAGPEQERLRRLAPDSVRFVGHVERDDLPQWYAAADALVAPSRSEPWGFAIQEAATAGLPIVATDAAGAAYDLVEDEVNGFRVPAGDAAALARAMRRVAGDARFRESAAARSRELASGFTAERWGDALVELAETTLRRR